jgi:fatty-acyl-CoA synthase
MQQFKAPKVLDVIEKKKVTIKVGVPTMFILELMELEKTKNSRDLSSLRQVFISGSECPAEIMTKIENKMGCQVMIGYGLTESTSYITVTNSEDSSEIRHKTVGSPIPGEKIKLIDNNGKEVFNTPGEIIVRGNSVMIGYFKNPVKTAEDIDKEGWFHTGDLGYFDENNNLIFQGRKKDLIIRGGYNIYAYEIENFLLKHKRVANAALIGLPDSVLGERSAACIITKPNCSLTEETIIDFCSKYLSDYKVPDFVFFFEKFPLTHNGKIKKELLKKEIIEIVELK